MPASMKSLAAAKDRTGLVATVLGLWKQDKRYYSVQVNDCDPEARNCQVIFDDGYKCWLEASELHCELVFDKLEEEEIVCCVCEGGNSEPPNDIIMCDSCQQGYHLGCHEPAVERSQVQPGDDQIEWMCNTCHVIALHANTSAPSPAPTAASNVPVGPRKRQSRTSTTKKTPAKTPSKTTLKTPSKTLKHLEPKSATKKNNKNKNENNKLKLDAPILKDADLPNKLKDKSLKAEAEIISSAVSKKPTPCSEDHNVTNSVAKPCDPKEGRVEKMNALIIHTARALAQEPSCLGTGEFVKMMGDDCKITNTLQTSVKGSKVNNRKREKTNSAAAF